MTLSSPYGIYILGAYGLTFLGLSLFLIKTVVQWKNSVQEFRHASYET